MPSPSTASQETSSTLTDTSNFIRESTSRKYPDWRLPVPPTTRLVGVELIEVVQAAQKGDRYAFGRIAQATRSFIYGQALARLKSSSDAENMVSDVLTHMMRKLPQLREPAALMGWIGRITANMCINHVTRKGSVTQLSSETEIRDSRESDPSQRFEQRRLAGVVHEILGRLKEDDSEVLRLFYIEGLSLQDIAETLEKPIGTIKRRLSVARGRFKKRWDGLEENMPAA